MWRSYFLNNSPSAASLKNIRVTLLECDIFVNSTMKNSQLFLWCINERLAWRLLKMVDIVFHFSWLVEFTWVQPLCCTVGETGPVSLYISHTAEVWLWISIFLCKSGKCPRNTEIWLARQGATTLSWLMICPVSSFVCSLLLEDLKNDHHDICMVPFKWNFQHINVRYWNVSNWNRHE